MNADTAFVWVFKASVFSFQITLWLLSNSQNYLNKPQTISFNLKHIILNAFMFSIKNKQTTDINFSENEIGFTNLSFTPWKSML